MKSVVKEPTQSSFLEQSIIVSFANFADDIPLWGTQPAARDKMLREFWPTENILSSAIYSTSSKYAALGWTIEGPPKTANAVRRILHASEGGRGWIAMIIKVLIDLFTQDNGAFIEVVRTSDSETAPVVELNHLDSARCIRTGRRADPVIYIDMDGKPHQLKWYQVIELTEFPSPIETARGLQYCAVSRLLRAAQILKDIAIYEREKISGRFHRAIYLVSGVQGRAISEAVQSHQDMATSQGLTKYIQPLIIASLDPTATVTMEKIELASLPDHFDKEIAMRWYVNQLALAFGQDYQDFAPLPGGNLGTSAQSQVLHLKSRGKGSALFMRMIEQNFNFHGIMPSMVTMRFGEQDVAEDLERVEVRVKRAQERQIRIASGEITPEIARQMAVDSGDLREEYLKLLSEANATEDVIISSSG